MRQAPGLYLDTISPAPQPAFVVGVPAFLSVRLGKPNHQEMDWWASIGASADTPLMAMDVAFFSRLDERGILTSLSDNYLGFALQGFFQNGGRRCFVVPPLAGEADDMRRQLDSIDAETGFDLVCAPNLSISASTAELVAAQTEMLRFCQKRGSCFAILDTLRCPGVHVETEFANVELHRQTLLDKLSTEGIDGAHGAMYLPWFNVQADENAFVPPSGHVAGVYARTDRTYGVHKAPANEVVYGVVDVELRVSAKQQEGLNPKGINCIRVLPGRGVRVWGARTLSTQPEWTYVNHRRLFVTIRRWLEQTMGSVIFEPNDFALWVRIRREVNAFLSRMFQAGALRGRTPEEAFFVKCDAETNTAAERAAGRVVTEIGLALEKPSEFVVARILQGSDRTITARPARVGS